MIRITEAQGGTLLRELGGIGGPAREVLETVNAQINNPSHFEDLIDVVVVMLKEPRLSSLNRDQLAALRQAILSPLELAKFRTLLGKIRNCIGCGKGLAEHEVVSITNVGVWCYQCSPMEHVTCGVCEQRVTAGGIGLAIKRALQKHSCSPSSQPTPPRDESRESIRWSARTISRPPLAWQEPQVVLRPTAPPPADNSQLEATDTYIALNTDDGEDDGPAV